MSSENGSQIKTAIHRERQLGYKSEFKQLIRTHSGLLNSALSLTKTAEKEYDPGDTTIGLYEVRWNKETQQWREIAYNNVQKKTQVY